MPRVRCRRCADGLPHDFPHGANSYREHGCRCDICRSANTAAARAYNKRIGNERKRERYDPVMRRERYYYADIDRIAARNRAYFHRNKDRLSLLAKAWRDRNPGACEAAYNRRMQKRKRVHVTRWHTAWTQEEDRIAMSNRGVLEIAHILGRSYSAVEGRRRALRVNQLEENTT